MEQCEYCGHPLKFTDSRGLCVVQMGDPEDVARGREDRCGCIQHGLQRDILAARAAERAQFVTQIRQ